MRPTYLRYPHLSYAALKRCREAWDHVLMQRHHSITSFIFFELSLVGKGSRGVKKWLEAQISGNLPVFFSYISYFVCLYNFNYTGRPLRGPGRIGIKGRS